MLVDETVTYLDMTSPDQLVAARVPPGAMATDRLDRRSVDLFRSTYERIAAPHDWQARRAWTNQEWIERLSRQDVEAWLARVEGQVAGIIELEVHEGGDVEMVVFGLTPEFIGRGLGGHLLTLGTRLAWEAGAPTTRVWLHTSSRDHPHALPNYERRGFRVFRRTQRRREIRLPDEGWTAADLQGRALPALTFRSTAGETVPLTDLGKPRSILYLYPMTGRPEVPMPHGWDLIPGALGCTAEACAFRDRHAELGEAGVDVYGLSSQSTAYQQEAVARLHLPFPLLSDERLALADALDLPTFTAGGMRLFERLTMVVSHGVIDHVFHPVVAPDGHAEEVLSWLRRRGRATGSP